MEKKEVKMNTKRRNGNEAERKKIAGKKEVWEKLMKAKNEIRITGDKEIEKRRGRK